MPASPSLHPPLIPPHPPLLLPCRHPPMLRPSTPTPGIRENYHRRFSPHLPPRSSNQPSTEERVAQPPACVYCKFLCPEREGVLRGQHARCRFVRFDVKCVPRLLLSDRKEARQSLQGSRAIRFWSLREDLGKTENLCLLQLEKVD